ncbi:MAG TPA: carbamoyltransferase [Chitinophagaceae bacterium]|jgi:carbamoyltransferase
MKILGISAYYHDSAAAIIHGGKVLAAAQEERFTRIKHDASFPSNAIRFCLDYTGYTIDELDAIVFYDKPFLKFERLLETYYSFAPRGMVSFLKAMPAWIKEKLFLKRNIYNGLKGIEKFDRRKLKLLFPEHHLSHAASAFYPSPFTEAAVLTLDGVGEWATASICKGAGNRMTVLKELDFPHSLGLLYSAFTYYCGFRVNSGEYKLMGLAPYGNRDSVECKRMVEIIRTKLVDIKEDGSFVLHQDYFTYATGLRMVPDEKWKSLFGFGRREEEMPLEQQYCDLAAAIQQVTEEIVLKLAAETKRLTGSGNLCLAGGVALNCVANGKLHASGLFNHIFIQPAAGDAGGALGAAYAAHYIYFDRERIINGEEADGLEGSYLGPEFGRHAIIAAAKKYKAVYREAENPEALTETVARLIAEGNVIGWFRGRMEFGPRALGARSILADARRADMQKKLNLKIKYRESFRPFAPAILSEYVAEYFDLKDSSPYMLLVKEINPSRRCSLPAGYQGFALADKLYLQRSDLPAITHVDYSARIQTVHRETNAVFWQLLDAFRQLTGCPVLINTSFNVRGEPIVNTPADAYRCFMQTEMDYLVIEDFIFDKKEQPAGSFIPGQTVHID